MLLLGLGKITKQFENLLGHAHATISTKNTCWRHADRELVVKLVTLRRCKYYTGCIKKRNRTLNLNFEKYST